MSIDFGIAEISLRAAIAALGDMVRMIGDDDTGETGHRIRCLQRRDGSIECEAVFVRRC
jgi:hypothetical protein